jgi:HrpA-like RNA helicase
MIAPMVFLAYAALSPVPLSMRHPSELLHRNHLSGACIARRASIRHSLLRQRIMPCLALSENKVDGSAGEPELPITPLLPELVQSLEKGPNLVLQAPPGAGKTTSVPLALLRDASWLRDTDKTILVLEPRRIAARSAATRMSSALGEQVGMTVGYRVRQESKVSSRTRIVCVTEGMLL